jgi:cytochrome c
LISVKYKKCRAFVDYVPVNSSADAIMKYLVCAVGFCLMAATFPAAGKAAVSRDPDLIEAGRALAHAACARCHGIGQTDESPLEQAPPFRRLHTRYPIEQLAEAFAEGIVVGHAEMPAFELEPDQIEALLAYLASLERRPRD